MAVVYLAAIFHVDYPDLSIGSQFSSFVNLWDAAWYRGVAEFGYSWNGNPKIQQNVAFFPLYPLLVHLVHLLVPSLTIAELTVAMACQVICLILVYDLYLVNGMRSATALRVTLLLMLFPVGIYSWLGYPVSLICLLTVASVLAYQKGRRWPAFALAGLGTAAGAGGLAVSAGLVVHDCLNREHRGWPSPTTLLRYAVGFGGIVGYSLYLGIKFHAPLAFVQAQAAWSERYSLGLLLTRFVTLSPIRDAIVMFLRTGGEDLFMHLQDALVLLVLIGIVLWSIFREWARWSPATSIITVGLVFILLFAVDAQNTSGAATRLVYPLLALVPAVPAIAGRDRLLDRLCMPAVALFTVGSAMWLFFLAHHLWVE